MIFSDIRYRQAAAGTCLKYLACISRHQLGRDVLYRPGNVERIRNSRIKENYGKQTGIPGLHQKP